MKQILILVAVLLLGQCAFSMVSYKDHKTVRVNGASLKQQQYFLDHFDVYRATRDFFEMELSPSELAAVRAMGLDIEILHDDVQALIDEEYSAIEFAARKNSTWFSNYHTYDEIKAWYTELARIHPGTTFIPSIGKTHQGRDIFAYKFGTPGKPQIYYESLIHAREWISGAVGQYITYHFLNTDKSLLADFEFVVVPVVNPDGYAYSWTNDRLWRKNRRNNGGSYGVDLNRNFNSHWGQGGSSSVPTSDTYKGPSVASEPETQAIAAFVKSQKNIVAGIDFHAYSQLILRPWGWTSADAKHEDEHFAAGAEIQRIIRSVNGKVFDNIKSIELYVTTGTVSDWFYDSELTAALGRSIYGYTIELRPSSAIPGFQLPPSEIIPSGEEIVPAFKFFAQNAVANPLN